MSPPTLWALVVLTFGPGPRGGLVLTFTSSEDCERAFRDYVQELYLPRNFQLGRPETFGTIRHSCIPGIAQPLNRAN